MANNGKEWHERLAKWLSPVHLAPEFAWHQLQHNPPRCPFGRPCTRIDLNELHFSSRSWSRLNEKDIVGRLIKAEDGGGDRGHRCVLEATGSSGQGLFGPLCPAAAALTIRS